MRFSLFLVAILLACAALLPGCRHAAKREVVIYTSVDQVYSEPILRAFEQESGIKVKAVYDVESAKTTGLTTRLIAEKQTPRADVFWNNEFANTLLLREKGILTPYRSPAAADLPAQYRDAAGYWAGMGGRARILIVNTRKLTSSQYPSSIFDLLDPKWPANAVGLAYPLFGTTATHAAALYATMGEKKARAFYARLKQRGVRTVDGNSVVCNQVANGQFAWGITDTDDALGAMKRGAPVAIIVPDQQTTGAFVIPGTVAAIAGAPHPAEGKALIDFLVSRHTEERLLASGGCQFSLRADASSPDWVMAPIKPLRVELSAVQQQMPRAIKDLRAIFTR